MRLWKAQGRVGRGFFASGTQRHKFGVPGCRALIPQYLHMFVLWLIPFPSPRPPAPSLDAVSLPAVAKSWNERSKGEVGIHVRNSVQRAGDALVLRLTWQRWAF